MFGPAGGTTPDEPSTPDAPSEDAGDLDDLFGEIPSAPDLTDDVSAEVPTKAAEAETEMIVRLWSDDTGLYKTEARLHNIVDGSVRLRKTNGKLCTVPFARLSQADLDYVQQQAAHFGVASLDLFASN